MENTPDYQFTKEVVTNTIRLRLLTNGVIHYTYLPNSEVDDVQHRLNYEGLLTLVGNKKKYPALLDGDDFANVTPEGRRMVRELEPFIPVSARAMVIKVLGQRILANFYIRFHQPIIPTKIFDNHQEAQEWLNQFINHS
ncbi:MAG: hypothetical protein HY062_06205 [Bacteroidetes bacterium]|nr:hypothetical protein [Bacteroidota bacterium]